MSLEWTDITLLCKVVDNYGDIGFVYRLARSLTEREPSLHLRLVVSDLISFAKMAPGLLLDKSEQSYNGWTVYDWNASNVCSASFKNTPPKVLLECFQCGRPEWLDDILFDKERTQTVHIINVEYLTAEKWADDFHLLKSGTRSPLVKKDNFMPGFTPQTGGLVLDNPFMEYVHKRAVAEKAVASYFPTEINVAFEDSSICKVLVFSYPRDFSAVVQSLAKYTAFMKQKDSRFSILIFAANGKSLAPFKEAYEHCMNSAAAINDSKVIELPFLPQNAWDALVTLMDVSFVRGEDSLSRACLAGVPFFWHAYPQAEEYQLVKVEALLERMEPYFEPSDYLLLKKMWLLYNKTEGEVSGTDLENCLYSLLLRLTALRQSFSSFAKQLENNGDLTQKLIAWLKQLHF